MKAAASRLLSWRFEGGQIVEGDFASAGHKFAEALAEELVAVDGKGAEGEAVEGVIAVDDFLAVGGAAGEFEALLRRFRSRCW